ncbi:MAG: hypothetical protein KJZ78_09900 [Bryobacteraceae bacterium]|nr:hypothetical protein [Bryobacteraceae bacterium]
MKEYFGSTELANDYLGRIQQGLRKSLAAGIALQQLGDRYSPDRLASLPQGAAAAIHRIAADHAAILRNRWPEVNALLEPVLTEMRLPHASAGVQPPGPQECVSWSGTSRDIVMDLRRVETSLHRSFIPYEGLGPAAVDPERLLDEIESARARLNRAIAGTCLP